MQQKSTCLLCDVADSVSTTLIETSKLCVLHYPTVFRHGKTIEKRSRPQQRQPNQLCARKRVQDKNGRILQEVFHHKIYFGKAEHTCVTLMCPLRASVSSGCDSKSNKSGENVNSVLASTGSTCHETTRLHSWLKCLTSPRLHTAYALWGVFLSPEKKDGWHRVIERLV